MWRADGKGISMGEELWTDEVSLVEFAKLIRKENCSWRQKSKVRLA